MSHCWESRGCDEGMQAVCPHSTTLLDRCPAKCAFVHCDLPHHERTSDPALIFDPDVDRTVAMRETCTYCAFFIRRGPRVAHARVADATDGDVAPRDTSDGAE